MARAASASRDAFLVLDKVASPAVGLSILRTSIALLSTTILPYGLVWEAE